MTRPTVVEEVALATVSKPPKRRLGLGSGKYEPRPAEVSRRSPRDLLNHRERRPPVVEEVALGSVSKPPTRRLGLDSGKYEPRPAEVSRRSLRDLLNRRERRPPVVEELPPGSVSKPPTRALGLDPTGRWVRILGGVVIIAFLVWQLGSGPFVDGLLSVSPWAVLVALVVTAGTTWCCAARWSLLSARLGRPVPLRTAYVAYYRSQLVNATLPGGVVGDVHRGLRHGWRGVLWDRGLGQLVQVALVLVLVLPAPYRWLGLVALAGLALAGGAVVLLSAAAVAESSTTCLLYTSDAADE